MVYRTENDMTTNPIPEQHDETPQEAPVLSDLQARIDALEKEVAEHKDAYLRATADYKNLKRRYDAERIELISRAGASLLLKLLPAVDDIERAVASVTPDVEGTLWYKGFRLIPQKFQNLLDSEGVTTVAAVGQPFDPNVHEAIAYEPCDADKDGHVVAELQRGYLLRDKILRPAMVKVGQKTT
jgi:molecular chaperone GrpE